MSTAPNPPGTFVAPGAAQETGKKRASRIPLDYFKKGTWLDAWKWRVSILCALVAVGYIVYTLLPAREESYSRGPVTHHHANLSCAACHEGFSSVKGVFDAKGSREAMEKKCTECHSGPTHHPNMKESMVVGCGGCHQEHRGVDASLIRLPDNECTSCHASLGASMTEKPAAGSRVYADKITDFASHPDFQRPARDPGNIKFNHALHMMPGQVEAPDMAGKTTFEKITKNDPAGALRYKAAQEKQGLATGPTAAVQLTCGSCHQLDAGDAGFKAGTHNYDKPSNITDAALQPRRSGAYYPPISYEIACQACHPLNVDKDLKDDKGAPLAAPHRLQLPELQRFLEGEYLRELVKPGKSDVYKESERPTRPLPGKLPPGEAEKMHKTAKDKAAAKLLEMRSSRAFCGECHADRDEKNNLLPEILPANIPQVWLPHARFDHVAHRATDCRSCHANTYPTLADGAINSHASKTSADINIPDVANCKECHGPRRTEGGQIFGGVRADCTGCHSYHHGTAPLLGPGAEIYDPRKKLDARGFLDLGRK